jgi:hypothetical protein
LDERYSKPINKGGISAWLKNQIKEPADFNLLKNSLQEFYVEMAKSNYVPKIKN